MGARWCAGVVHFFDEGILFQWCAPLAAELSRPRDGYPAIATQLPREVTVDVALVADADVPAAELAEALEDGGGDLLEEVRLFDLYTGEQVAPGRRSLAFRLRFRAPDRTLTSEEANAARDAAVAVAADRHGATLR